MGIILENVKKIYKAGEVTTYAIKGVDLEVKKGEFVCILGPSGSGKSTLLNCISGLDLPTSGRIVVDGKDISHYSSEQLTVLRKEYFGFVFQSYNLFNSLKVGENVDLIASLTNNPLDTDKVLKSVGIYDQKNKFPSQLSGGQQQRVSIARAVVKNPKILFCDEPTGALDEKSSKDVLEVLERLNEEHNTTIVIITHNIAIAGMSDKVIKVNSGEIVEIIENSCKIRAKDLIWGN